MNPAKFGRFFYVQYDAQTMGIQPSRSRGLSVFAPGVGAAEPGGPAGRRRRSAPLCREPSPQRRAGGALGCPRDTCAPGVDPRDAPGRDPEARFGRHPVGECDAVDDTPGSLARLRRRILDGVRLRGEVIRTLIQRPRHGTPSSPVSRKRTARGITSGGSWIPSILAASRRTDLPWRPGRHHRAASTGRSMRKSEKILDLVGPDVRCLRGVGAEVRAPGARRRWARGPRVSRAGPPRRAP